MKKLNVCALTEKGVLKGNVRVAVTENVIALVGDVLEDLGFETYADQKAVALPYEDMKGNKVYATLTLTVGTKAPDQKAEKKSTHKKKVAEVIDIE